MGHHDGMVRHCHDDLNDYEHLVFFEGQYKAPLICST